MKIPFVRSFPFTLRPRPSHRLPLPPCVCRAGVARGVRQDLEVTVLVRHVDAEELAAAKAAKEGSDAAVVDSPGELFVLGTAAAGAKRKADGDAAEGAEQAAAEEDDDDIVVMDAEEAAADAKAAAAAPAAASAGTKRPRDGDDDDQGPRKK